MMWPSSASIAAATSAAVRTAEAAIPAAVAIAAAVALLVAGAIFEPLEAAIALRHARREGQGRRSLRTSRKRRDSNTRAFRARKIHGGRQSMNPSHTRLRRPDLDERIEV